MKTLIVLDFQAGTTSAIIGVEHMSETEIEELVSREFSPSTQYMVQDGCHINIMDFITRAS